MRDIPASEANTQVCDPFFSILIPTRNRPKLVEETIQSVLTQTFADFEVLISNNGQDLETKLIASGFCRQDHRFRYAEYDNLSMHEHWEHASRLLHGKYILILTDRSLLFRDSLQVVFELIAEKNYPEVVSWRMQQYLDESSILLHDSDPTSATTPFSQILCPEQIFLDEINGSSSSWSERLPRGLNSAVSRNLIKDLRRKYGAVFRPISPDFVFATFCLLNADHLLFINKPLFLTRAMNVSNGGLGYSGEVNPSFIKSLGEDFEWFRHVPCKEMLLSNTIFEDYCNIACVCGREDLLQHFNISAYYQHLLRELEVKTASGRLAKSRLSEIYNGICVSISDDLLKEHILSSVDHELSISRLKQSKLLLLRILDNIFPSLTGLLRRIVIPLRRHGQYYPSALAAASSVSHFGS